MTRRTRLAALLGAILMTATACGKRATYTPLALPVVCDILPPSPLESDTVMVALPDTPEPSAAPWGRNDSESLVFRQLYETLFMIDCNGDAVPQLASSWRRVHGGRAWRFELRKGARFWDGTRVQSAHILSAWRDPMTLPVGVDSVQVDGEAGLTVFVRHASDAPPSALASAAFAITGPGRTPGWPGGTAPRQVAQPIRAGSSRDVIVSRRGRDQGPVLRFVTMPARDPRDWLGHGVDLIVTRGAEAADYASVLSGVSVRTLPWDRTYVLLSASRVHALRTGHDPPTLPQSVLDDLARDAVHGAVRGSRPGWWWTSLHDCDGDTSPRRATVRHAIPAASPRHIVYDAADPIARGLAERVVALGLADPANAPAAAALRSAIVDVDPLASAMTALGVDERAFGERLRAGSDFAYVVALPRLSPMPCYEYVRAMKTAPWFAHSPAAFEAALIPLVDTCRYIIATERAPSVTVDGYGNLTIGQRVAGGR